MAAINSLSRHALRPCPLCGAGEVRVLHGMRFALARESPLPSAYDVVSCARCRFVYADTAGTAADYERHYAEHSRYEDPALSTGGGDRPEDRARIDELAGWIATRAPADARIADIGCANGGVLEALRERGFKNLTGIDPAPGCVSRLRARGFSAWQGTLARLHAEAGPFDVVLLSHVLEHVLDPRAALRALHDRLSPGAQLCIETPDAARYAGRPFVPFYFFDAEHINHFDVASLADLGAREGYALRARLQAELVVEGGKRYPVARVLLARADRSSAAGNHRALAEAVQAYVEESRRHGGDAALAALVASGRTLALWGAGSQAQRLMGGALASAKFAAVVDRDRNKQGLLFAGCRVAAPEAGLRGLPRDAVVVVAAALAADAIVAECRSMGLTCHLPGDAG